MMTAKPIIVQHKLSFLAWQEHNHWVAQCIEYELATQSPTLEGLFGAVRDLLVGNYEAYSSEDLDPLDLRKPTIPLGWAWNCAVALKRELRGEVYPTKVVDQFDKLEMRVYNRCGSPPYRMQMACCLNYSEDCKCKEPLPGPPDPAIARCWSCDFGYTCTLRPTCAEMKQKKEDNAIQSKDC